MITCTPLAIYRQRLVNALRAVSGSTRFSMLFYSECGTPGCVLGCVLGWYAHRRDLQEAFELSDHRADGGGCGGIRCLRTGNCLDYDSQAIQQHFGISGGEARELFSVGGCGGADNNAGEAVTYLRRFINAKYPQWKPL